MSHGVASIEEKDIHQIVQADPLRLSWLSKIVLWVFVGLGIFAFLKGVQTDPKRSWISLHVNFTYWFLLAAASTCFSSVITICNAQWARSLRRFFEASSRFLSVSALMIVILYFANKELFPWATTEIPGKAMWLEANFLYARDIVGVLLLSFLATRVVYFSLQRDIGAIRGGLTGLDKDKLTRWFGKGYDKFTKGWSNDTVLEIEKVTAKMGKFSPAVIICYSLVMSLIAFDQIMSVDPHWYSTLFGGHYFMSGAYIAVAWCAISLVFARGVHPLFLAKVDRKLLHDLGKLLFGFGIFWAYLFWSHYLPIWYANIPEETAWIILRFRDEPWRNIAWIIFGLSFVIPFLLGLSREVKQIPGLLLITAVIAAFGIWLQQYILFAPSHYPKEIPLGFLDIGISLGFMGAYLLSAFSFLEKYPLIPFGELYDR